MSGPGSAGRRSVERWPGSPGIRFLVLGALLYGLETLVPANPPAPTPLVFSAQRIADLRTDFVDRWGRPPTPDQLATRVHEAIDEELLEREARRLGLDQGDLTIRQRLISKMRAVAADPSLDDPILHDMARDLGFDDDVVVRRLLRQKMRLLLQRQASGEVSTDEDLAAVLERHRERFSRPATVSFHQVFLSTRQAGERVDEVARLTAAEIRDRELEPAKARELSHPFPLPLAARPQSRIEIARHFGEAFADWVMELAPGSWSEPLASPYGRHLVWVSEKHPERLPTVEDAHEPLSRLLEEERAAARLATGLQRLRQQQPIIIEWATDEVGP